MVELVQIVEELLGAGLRCLALRMHAIGAFLKATEQTGHMRLQSA